MFDERQGWTNRIFEPMSDDQIKHPNENLEMASRNTNQSEIICATSESSKNWIRGSVQKQF